MADLASTPEILSVKEVAEAIKEVRTQGLGFVMIRGSKSLVSPFPRLAPDYDVTPARDPKGHLKVPLERVADAYAYGNGAFEELRLKIATTENYVWDDSFGRGGSQADWYHFAVGEYTVDLVISDVETVPV